MFEVLAGQQARTGIECRQVVARCHLLGYLVAQKAGRAVVEFGEVG